VAHYAEAFAVIPGQCFRFVHNGVGHAQHYPGQVDLLARLEDVGHGRTRLKPSVRDITDGRLACLLRLRFDADSVSRRRHVVPRAADAATLASRVAGPYWSEALGALGERIRVAFTPSRCPG
jgi:hypothetical protein